MLKHCILNLSLLILQFSLLISNSVLVSSTDTKSDVKNLHSDTKNFNYDDFKKFPSFSDHRDVIVHLQDWKYKEIEEECPKLEHMGYAAVQISPVTSYAHFDDHPWDERLSVTSYDFDNASGNEKDLEHMIGECNRHNIKVFADVVINNMARSDDVDKNGQNFQEMLYKNKDGSVLYQRGDFHPGCDIKSENYVRDTLTCEGYTELPEESVKPADKINFSNLDDALISLREVRKIFGNMHNKEGFERVTSLLDYSNLEIVRTCRLENRQDLDQIDHKKRPLKPIIDLFLKLLYLGVSGFRIISADHIKPEHLDIIYQWLPKQPVFIYHDVYDPLHSEIDNYLIHSDAYAVRTRATDYRYARLLSRTFLTRHVKVNEMYKLQKELGLLPSDDSVVFVNNFITIGLGHKGLGGPVLSDVFIYPGYSLGDKALQLAVAFMLIHGHGIPLITSSFDKENRSKYRKEHTWPTIKHMINFRRVLKKYNNGVIPPPDNFIKYDDYQVSYCIGTTGFVTFNYHADEKPFEDEVKTCFTNDGIYCDVFGGGLNHDADKATKPCKNNLMEVTNNGKVGKLKMKHYEGLAAFYIEAMVPNS